MVLFCQHVAFRRTPSLRAALALSLTCGFCFLLRFDSILLTAPALVQSILQGRRSDLSLARASLALVGAFDLGSGFNDLAYHIGPLPCGGG